jgi:hypothetical protein
MKPTKTHLGLLTLLLAQGHAAQIGINFHSSTAASGHTVPAGAEAGIAPLEGADWNSIGLPFGTARRTLTTPLADDSGNANAATLSFDLNQAYVGNSGSAGGGEGDHALMASYISWDPIDGTNPEDSGEIAITGLGADFTGPGYDVYVYFDADVNNRTFTFTLNGTASPPCADASTCLLYTSEPTRLMATSRMPSSA